MIDPGIVLSKRYEILGEIGAGGMAHVYKAKDYKLRRMVALKVLKHEYYQDEAVLSKFKKEALAAGGLTHPNIVAVYDLGQEYNIDYIVMEYIDGLTLKEYIKRRDVMGSEEVLKIAIKIAEALKAAHANGIIHRDIKPQNIMVTQQGDVKVTDFGIAKAATSSTITQRGEALGSVHYFSPEQARGSFVDARSDLYSLGITMYEMVTKQLPFTGDSPVAVAMKHLHDPLPEPQKMAPQIWPGLRDIIVKLTQKRPELRYQSAEELILDMKRVYKNPGFRIRPVQPKEVPVRNEYGASRRPPVKSREEQERERQILIAQREERMRQQKRRKNLIIACGAMGIVLLVLLVFLMKAILAGDTEKNEDSVSNSIVTEQQNSSESNDETSEDFIEEESSVVYPKMPTVKGMYYRDAQNMLKDMKIRYETVEEYDSEVDAGYIIMQEPSAETEITENVKVVLHISKGAEQKLVKVPNVTNMPLDEAEALLNENGLELGEVSSDFSSVYEEGYVINQGTVKDKEVLEGTEIDVTVSLGEEESSEVKKGGTITITSPFTKEDEKGNMVVQAYDEQNKAVKIHDTEVSYNLFKTSGGAIKVNYPAGTTKVEVFLNGKLIMSETVNE
ncbi:MAG: Stk1 family PASTA domain-containing Ser/Thr kinase [Firmicutes bacterium]|nr:Stk1 family PASTA domain-containing Ser/Thr kinase [Bacillota bacterium]